MGLKTLFKEILNELKSEFEGTVRLIFQPGEEIFVKYDPYDKTKVAIEHS